MFIRKLYYDNITGQMVSVSLMQGNVRLTTFEDDLSRLSQLSEYRDKPEQLGRMVWTEPDSETEAAFETATGYHVDVSQTPHQLVFDYTPIESGILTSDEVVGILTGEVE